MEPPSRSYGCKNGHHSFQSFANFPALRNSGHYNVALILESVAHFRCKVGCEENPRSAGKLRVESAFRKE